MYVGKTKQADEISQNVLNTQDAFSGTIGDLNSAKQLGGKRMMFGKKKANKFIEKQNKKNEYLDNLITTNTYSKQSDYATDLSQQNVNKTQGASFMNNSIGKNGMKLMPLNVAKQKLLLNTDYSNNGRNWNGEKYISICKIGKCNDEYEDDELFIGNNLDCPTPKRSKVYVKGILFCKEM